MTKQICWLWIGVLLGLFSCQTDRPSQSEALEKAKSNKIDSLAGRYLELNRFSGTITVAKGASLVYNQSFGLANYESQIPFSTETTFKIGEATELVTFKLLNRLVQQGLLQSTDSLRQHFPDLATNWTIDQVLRQGSKRWTGSTNPEEKAEVDYNTLGRLIEKGSNKSYQENVAAYAQDLALKNTYYQKEDTALALGYLYHNYRGKGLELQKSPSFDLKEAYSSKGLKSTGHDLVKIIAAHPLDLKINGYLDTDGFSYSISNNLADSIAVIVLSNRRHPVASEISNSIRAILKGRTYRLPLARKPVPVDPNLLKEYIGKYAINENVSFEVMVSNDRLFALLGPTKVALLPQSDHQFYMPDNDAAMRFERDSNKVINSIRLLNGFMDSPQQALRIKE